MVSAVLQNKFALTKILYSRKKRLRKNILPRDKAINRESDMTQILTADKEFELLLINIARTQKNINNIKDKSGNYKKRWKL